MVNQRRRRAGDIPCAAVNVIAGASAIPAGLRQMTGQFRAPTRQTWRELILPAIFPCYVTGGITAAGGTWNASNVTGYVTYGKTPARRARTGRLHHPGLDRQEPSRGILCSHSSSRTRNTADA